MNSGLTDYFINLANKHAASGARAFRLTIGADIFVFPIDGQTLKFSLSRTTYVENFFHISGHSRLFSRARKGTNLRFSPSMAWHRSAHQVDRGWKSKRVRLARMANGAPEGRCSHRLFIFGWLTAIRRRSMCRLGLVFFTKFLTNSLEARSHNGKLRRRRRNRSV